MNRREALKTLLVSVAGVAVANPLLEAERAIERAIRRLPAGLGWLSINGAPMAPFFDPVLHVVPDEWTALEWRLATNPDFKFGMTVRMREPELDLVQLVRVDPARKVIHICPPPLKELKAGRRFELDDLVLEGDERISHVAIGEPFSAMDDRAPKLRTWGSPGNLRAEGFATHVVVPDDEVEDPMAAANWITKRV